MSNSSCSGRRAAKRQDFRHPGVGPHDRARGIAPGAHASPWIGVAVQTRSGADSTPGSRDPPSLVSLLRPWRARRSYSERRKPRRRSSIVLGNEQLLLVGRAWSRDRSRRSRPRDSSRWPPRGRPPRRGHRTCNATCRCRRPLDSARYATPSSSAGTMEMQSVGQANSHRPQATQLRLTGWPAARGPACPGRRRL